MAILLISDELLELIGMSNRIAIMQHGRITAVIDSPPAAKPTEEQLIHLMLTQTSPLSRDEGQAHDQRATALAMSNEVIADRREGCR